MQIKKLANGLTVLVDKKPGDSVAIEIQVNAGSNHEPETLAGISHVLEHMLFEGTKERTSQALVHAIERVGGEINAATTHERTFYYVHVPKKNFKTGLMILADMFQNSTFQEHLLEKEKKVIINEIDMINDDPQQYQWIMLKKHLFSKSNVKRPIYGSVKTVSSITRNDIIAYYKQYYVPNNVVISLSGNIPTNTLQLVKEAFGKMTPVTLHKPHQQKDPLPLPEKKRFSEHRDVEHVYFVLGYRAPPRNHKDSYVLEIIQSILGRGQSSRLFSEIRGRKGLVYHVGAYYDSGIHYGMFSAYFNCVKDNVQKAKKLLIEQLSLPDLTQQELVDAKTAFVGSFLLIHEDHKERADSNAFYYLTGQTPKQHLNAILKVTLQDVQRVVKKYFTENAIIVRLEKKH